MRISPETFNGLVGRQALSQLELQGTLLEKQGWEGSHPLRKEENKRKRKTIKRERERPSLIKVCLKLSTMWPPRFHKLINPFPQESQNLG